MSLVSQDTLVYIGFVEQCRDLIENTYYGEAIHLADQILSRPSPTPQFFKAYFLLIKGVAYSTYNPGGLAAARGFFQESLYLFETCQMVPGQPNNLAEWVKKELEKLEPKIQACKFWSLVRIGV
ncbi:hypothetical protein BJ508DRAFT_25766 [Ascobolus immersus RN42]|uniref:Uncharacterized protein n=1 Tax=Ascobolus immersus RN42 TaxID=1160509 RepID=A0A3N4IKN4_ASCIM|nr:hypothetical protein BJ508DRAFT_25766 [Ascobolus immersus RN42]